MIRTLFFSLLLATAVSAQLPDQTLEQLRSPNLKVRQAGWDSLEPAAAQAGRPGAEDERKALCLQLCAELDRQPPAHAARLLLECLQRIGGAESVPALARQLQGSDEHLRAEARRALAENPAPDAGRVLMHPLKQDANLSPRETAGLIYALGERRQADAVPMLAGFLTHSDDLVFTAAVEALVLIGDRDAMRALAQSRAEAGNTRKSLLTQALMGSEALAVFEQFYTEGEAVQIHALAFLGLLVNGRREAAADLLETEEPLMWSALFEAALQTRDPRLLDWTSIHLNIQPPLQQLQALGTLKAVGNPLYAQHVEPLLNSETDYLRSAAIQTLGRIGRTESVPLLLASDAPEAVEALSRLDAPGADEILESAAAGEAQPDQRARAIRALALRSREDLMQNFFEYALSDSAPVAEAGVYAISQLGHMQQLEPLTQLLLEKAATRLSRDIQEAAVAILRRSTQPEKAVAVLTAPLNEASPRGQALILQVLAQVGTREALAPVVKACNSPDEAVQKQAFKLLGGWRNPEALPDMLTLAADPDVSLVHHVQLMRGISRLLAEQKRVDEQQLLQALNTCRRPDEKKALIPMLANAKSPKAKALFEQYRSDPDLKETVEQAQAQKDK